MWRPRRLPQDRRAAPRPTLDWEEPDKSDYFLRDDDTEFSALEDWNDYVFRASVPGRLRFTFSASFTEATTDDILLSLDEAEEV